MQEERTPPNMRPFLILELLGSSGQAMTAAQIQRELGLPKQTRAPAVQCNGAGRRPGA